METELDTGRRTAGAPCPERPKHEAVEHAASRSTRRVAAVLLFNLAGYFLIGLPIAVVPMQVHDALGYGVVMAGAAVSSQYLATLLSRAWAGRLCDLRGPKVAAWRCSPAAAPACWRPARRCRRRRRSQRSSLRGSCSAPAKAW
jgi:hypothetical protein